MDSSRGMASPQGTQVSVPMKQLVSTTFPLILMVGL
jgi:hypothetical protein